MLHDDIVKFAKEQGYDNVKQLADWNGYEVYEPFLNTKALSIVGLPLLILVKENIIRMSTCEEAFEQMDNA